MTSESGTAAELLKQAIRSEIDGYRFYTYLAEKTVNRDARRKLTTLATDEKRHEAALKGIYRKVYGEDASEIPEKGIGVLSEFFNRPEGREGMTEIQYIDMAIEAELVATRFYKEGADATPDEEIRKIYQGMAAEEFSHYESLQAEKAALGDNYYWFGFSDGSPMEE